MIEGSGNPAGHTRSGGRRRVSQADSNSWESGRGLLLGRNPSWRRAYHALLTSISHDQDLRKMCRNRLELRGLAAPDGVALLRERDQEFESGSLHQRVTCEPNSSIGDPQPRTGFNQGERSHTRHPSLFACDAPPVPARWRVHSSREGPSCSASMFMTSALRRQRPRNSSHTGGSDRSTTGCRCHHTSR